MFLFIWVALLMLMVKRYLVTSMLSIWVSRLAQKRRTEKPLILRYPTMGQSQTPFRWLADAGCFPKIKGKTWFRQHLPEEKMWQLHNGNAIFEAHLTLEAEGFGYGRVAPAWHLLVRSLIASRDLTRWKKMTNRRWVWQPDDSEMLESCWRV